MPNRRGARRSSAAGAGEPGRRLLQAPRTGSVVRASREQRAYVWSRCSSRSRDRAKRQYGTARSGGAGRRKQPEGPPWHVDNCVRWQETRPILGRAVRARARVIRRARMRKVGVAVAVAGVIASLALAAPAVAQTTIDPSDPRLVPNPIETSDEGTVWTCRLTGTDVQCTGALTMSWELQEGPGDWCAVP